MTKLLLALSLFCAPSLWAQCVAPVNESHGTSSTAGATQTFAGLAAASTGNNVAVFGHYGGPNASVTVSLAMPNVTWTSIATTNYAGTTFATGFAARGIVAGGPSGTTLTATLSASVNTMMVDMIEEPGLMVPTTLDAFGLGTLGSGTTVNSNNSNQSATTAANDCVIAAALFDTPTGSITAQPAYYTPLSFTQDLASGFSMQTNYLAANAVGNQTPQWTYSSSVRSIGFVLPFKMPVVPVQCVAPVNESHATSSTAGATQTFPLTPATGGNTVIVSGHYGGPNASVTVSLAMPNVTWTSIATTNYAGTTFATGFAARGIVAGGPSGTTLTATLSASVNTMMVDMIEEPGLMVPTTLDAFGLGTLGSGTTVNSNNIDLATSTVGNDCIIAIALFDTPLGSISAQPAGYTSLSFTQDLASGFSMQTNYLAANAIGNQMPQWTYSSSVRSIAFVLPFEMPVASAQCSAILGTLDSNCPSSVTVTGNVANTFPLVYCAADVPYSTMGNTPARLANVCYLANNPPTGATGAIFLSGHGGGDDEGTNHGDFMFAANSGASLVYPLQLGVVSTVISYNYTEYTDSLGGLGTPGPYPAPLSDDGCAARWAATKAGLLFPGNPNNFVRGAFSWGTHMLFDNSWAIFSTTCEWTQIPAVRLGVVLSPVYDIAGQWNNTYGAAGASLDGTFWPAIVGAFGCTKTPQTSCTTASAPYDARILRAAATNPMRIAMVVDGSTDTITNPLYQGAAMVSDMGASNIISILVAGTGHGADGHTLAKVMTGTTFPALMRAIGDAGMNSRGAGGSSGSTGASGGIF